MAKKSFSKNKRPVMPKSINKREKQVPKAKSTEVVYHSTKEIKVERALIENFIGLQKVMLNLSNKFDSLSSQISKLLDLFEISAKSLARKELEKPGADSNEARRIMEKLDNISKQAGLIGRGLALIHEVGTENQNPVIPLNLQKSRSTFSPGAQPISMVPKNKVTQQSTSQATTSVSSSNSLINPNMPQDQQPKKKLTRELDAESFEQSSTNNSGMP